MKKVEKELYIKHAKRLEAILNEQSSFIKFLSRADFNNVIKTELNVLFACEKLFPKVELEAKYTAKALTKQFNKLTKSTFKIDESFKYDDQTDLIDSINYLVTFCNNMFSVNLDDLLEGKKVTATDPKIDLRAKDMSDDGGQRISPNFAFAGGIPLSSTPYENPYLIGKATAKLSDDMMSGKFYKFKTKPRIVPIMKLISVILLMLLTVSLIVTSIFTFLSSQLIVSDDSDSGSIPGVVGSGVFYLVVAGFSVYPLVVTLRTLVGARGRNDNLKYYFNWPIVLIGLVLPLLFLLLDLNRTWLLPYSVADSPTIGLVGWMGWKIMFIVTCAIIGLNVIPLIIGSVNNPKVDTQAIDNKMKEYIDMFSSQSGTAPVPPKVDVQKPTSVKEPKKDSKHKKDSKK